MANKYFHTHAAAGRNFFPTTRVSGAMRAVPAVVLAALALLPASAFAATWSAPVTISAPHTLVGPVNLTRAPSGSLEAWWGYSDHRGSAFVPGHAHAYHFLGESVFRAERRAPADLLDLQAFGDDNLMGVTQTLTSARTQRFRVGIALGNMGAFLPVRQTVETTRTAYLPQMSVASNGRPIVASVVRSGPRRIVRVATRASRGRFGRPITIFGRGRADVISTAIGERGDMVVAIAQNGKLRARVKRARGRWGPVQTLAVATGPTQWQIRTAVGVTGRVEVVWRRHQLNRAGRAGRRSLEATYMAGNGRRFARRQVLEADGATGPSALAETADGFAVGYAKDAPGGNIAGGVAIPRVKLAAPRFGRAYDASTADGGLRDVRVAYDGRAGVFASWIVPTPEGDGGGAGWGALLESGAPFFGSPERVTPFENVSEIAVDFDTRTEKAVAVWAARPEGTGPGVPIDQVHTVVRTSERTP